MQSPPPGSSIPPRPAVSILLPCRDAGPFLQACSDSLERQSLSDYEVLAVNDGSHDATAELLGAWAARDSRVSVLNVERQGLVAALSLAAGAAGAPILARMDADDLAHPERLARQLALLAARPDLAACGTGVELFPVDRVGPGYARYARWLNGLHSPEDVWRDLLVECPIGHPTLMIRASVLRALGGYRDCGWPEDYDLILRLHAAGMRAANVPAALLRWRVREDRHSLSSERYSPAAFRRCKVHYLRTVFLPAGRPLVVWGAGKVGKPFARELLRQGSEVSAFVDLDPRKIGQEIHGAPVLSPADFARPADESGPYVLVAVGSPGAREDIRLALTDLGWREIDDYRVCA
jgi:glycosyltransferase involved in cell wall biosynthesis